MPEKPTHDQEQLGNKNVDRKLRPSEERLRAYIRAHGIRGRLLLFDRSCGTTKEAAEAAGVDEGGMVKNIGLIHSVDGGKQTLIIAIVPAAGRCDNGRVNKAVREQLGTGQVYTMNRHDLECTTSYPTGGIPSFGISGAVYVIDQGVLQIETIYTSGGSDQAIFEMSSADLQSVNGGLIADIQTGKRKK